MDDCHLVGWSVGSINERWSYHYLLYQLSYRHYVKKSVYLWAVIKLYFVKV